MRLSADTLSIPDKSSLSCVLCGSEIDSSSSAPASLLSISDWTPTYFGMHSTASYIYFPLSLTKEHAAMHINYTFGLSKTSLLTGRLSWYFSISASVMPAIAYTDSVVSVCVWEGGGC